MVQDRFQWLSSNLHLGCHGCHDDCWLFPRKLDLLAFLVGKQEQFYGCDMNKNKYKLAYLGLLKNIFQPKSKKENNN